MRIFIHGLQTSGASFVSFLLSQKPNSLAIVDLGVGLSAPRLPFVKNDVLLKSVVNTRVSFQKQKRRFRADKVALVMRNPFVNYWRLQSKPYAGTFGNIDEKFQILESIYSSGDYDCVLLYEDCLINPARFIESARKLEYGVEESFFEFRRDASEILEANRAASSWFRKPGRWGFGNIHFETENKRFNYSQSEGVIRAKKELAELGKIPEEVLLKVRDIAPGLCELYEQRHPEYC